MPVVVLGSSRTFTPFPVTTPLMFTVSPELSVSGCVGVVASPLPAGVEVSLPPEVGTSIST